MDDFSNWTEVKKTRKDHKCFGCNHIIPTGSRAKYHAGVWEGDFTASYYCIPCDDFMTKNPEYFEEGIYSGEIGEIRREIEEENGELSA